MAHFYTPANESHPMKLILLAMSILIVFVFSHVGSHAPLDPDYSITKAVAVVADNPPATTVTACPTLTQPEVEANLQAHGFNAAQAHTMAAIARAESNLRFCAEGDQHLANAKWGSSVSIFQIRTLNNPGSNKCRDRNYLTTLDNQSQCAYEISRGGTYWTPWSCYLNKAYLKWL